MPGYAANGLDHFANAEPATGTEIVDKLAALTQRIENKNVRAGKIADMNVIADACAVWRGIVGTEDGDVLALSQRHLQRERNQVRLGHVILAKITGSSRSVEITEAGIPQSVDAVKPGQHLLHEQF